MARVGIVLSGCGVYDGAEIHESVMTLLALDEADAEVVWIGPNIDQMHVINHQTGDVAGEMREVLVESARIARGKVLDAASIKVDMLDAVVFPGGFGAAKNLCDFAVNGPDCTVNRDIAQLIRIFYEAKKPLGFACIAPALAAAAFRDMGIKEVALTVGSNDDDAAKAIEAMGQKHVACKVTDSHVDPAHRISTTPAYMQATRVTEIRQGIAAMINDVLGMIDG